MCFSLTKTKQNEAEQCKTNKQKQQNHHQEKNTDKRTSMFRVIGIINVKLNLRYVSIFVLGSGY